MHAPALPQLSLPRCWTRLLNALALLALGGCAGLQTDSGTPALNRSGWAQENRLADSLGAAVWTHQTIGSRTPSRYTPVQHQGRPALRAQSDGGDSLIRTSVAPPGLRSGRLTFSWFVEQLNTEADLQDRERDDAVVRVILQFDGDRSVWSPRDQRVSEWVRLATGEPLPHATLMYVWDPVRPVGTVLRHPRTDRIRLIVVESGPQRLGRWLDYERDVRSDYEMAFGKAPKGVLGLGLMTDSNNTRQASQAWYGPLRWRGATD